MFIDNLGGFRHIDCCYYSSHCSSKFFFFLICSFCVHLCNQCHSTVYLFDSAAAADNRFVISSFAYFYSTFTYLQIVVCLCQFTHSSDSDLNCWLIWNSFHVKKIPCYKYSPSLNLLHCLKIILLFLKCVLND